MQRATPVKAEAGEMPAPGQGQDQVQANAGFQAQPCFQRVQVHVLRGYSAFWPENHFTWQI